MSDPEHDAAGTPTAAAPAKKKRLIIVGAAAAVLLAAGGGWAMLGGSNDKAEATAEQAPAHGEEAEGGGESFVDVPPMVVNLRTPDGGARFLKIHLVLVPGPKATPEKLTQRLPLLLDAYQSVLRELRPDDLAGSAAVYRIKEELLVRATTTLGADQVKDVLIQDLIQQ
ncbi:flagellar basal body-associated FliL family protein [Sphingomonas hylomeconis]|uniref:Flagellar protein FliL n=1 Tax=Sphingomonas hylomeconis TaxID=1395958 RepID=A0ABV7SNZ1_9SPHN|nr:flagellar basal body-associated FliL family protein [Sphingomonas hylomeconis]